MLCVGLDTDFNKIPERLRSMPLSEALFTFNREIIDATSAHCIAYKPNLAFYECYGREGLEALEKTVDHIRTNHPEQFIIADAKRGDIGNTAKMYAKESGEQQKDFTLIIDDSAVYHTLNDFRSAEARKLYQQRIQKQKDYDNLKKNLDDKREQYAQGNSARKKNLTPAILELEKRTEQLLKEMAQLDISVRNEEIKKLKH